jgi:hypothetical protein
MAYIQPSTDPLYPWDPNTGCQACCSGEPYPTEPQVSVSAVAI